MLATTLLMAAIALAMLAVGYAQGNGAHLEGAKRGFAMALPMLPLLGFAFLVAGLMQALIPQELISKWLGAGSGVKGIFVASFLGAIMPGGPYVSLPLATGLIRAGAGVGQSVAFLSGWAIWGINRLPMEFGILGWKLTLIKFVCSLAFPPIAGIAANALFGRVQL